MMKKSSKWIACCFVLLHIGATSACTLCGGPDAQVTLRRQAQKCDVVILGQIGTARESPEAIGGGTTEFQVLRVIKGVQGLPRRGNISLPRFLADERKEQRLWLLFGDVRDGQFDYSSARRVRDIAVGEYLTAVFTSLPEARLEQLTFFANRLDHSVAEISSDAFAELSLATDREIGDLGKSLDATKIRPLVTSTKTLPERLGLLAFLLAASGKKDDAVLLKSLLDRFDDRSRPAYGGLLAGYIVLAPEAGWQFAKSLIGDSTRPFLQRYAVFGAIRFLQGWRGDSDRNQAQRVYEVGIRSSDLADMAVEDLRRWQWWGLTPQILALATAKSHEGPIWRRAVLRYALSCPDSAAAKFVASERQRDPEFVKEMSESLQDEAKQ